MRKLVTLLVSCLIALSVSARNPRGLSTGAGGGGGTGVWTNVTPAGPNLSNANLCGTPGNFGTETIGHDSASQNILYAAFDYQGIYKSTDYGQTWTHINTGTNGSVIDQSCGAGLTVGGTAGVVYFSSIRATGSGVVGFFVSTNYGVDWTNYNLSPLASNRQDVYPPEVDPYNANHLIMSSHETPSGAPTLIQSTDGGATWSSVNVATTGGASGNGMIEAGGTGFAYFINTGNSSTTAQTILWTAQQNTGTYGTWRTTNGGTSWTQVSLNEHPHGTMQIYQPNTTGDVFMGGAYASGGWGVQHSSDYGATWTQVGATSNESVVTGTSKNLYAMYGWAAGLGCSNLVGAAYETAPAAGGGGTWTNQTLPNTACPGGIYQGAGHIDVVNDGSHNILVGAMWGAGIWRYIEP